MTMRIDDGECHLTDGGIEIIGAETGAADRAERTCRSVVRLAMEGRLLSDEMTAISLWGTVTDFAGFRRRRPLLKT